jgi:hypothetical protein
MQRKKILIVSHAMEIGGAERALLGLLENIDTEKYEVDLFLMRHEGELLNLIPNNINLLPEIPAYTVLARPMQNTLKEGHLLLTAARLYGKYKAKKFDKQNSYTESTVAIEYSHKYIKKFMPEIQKGVTYDLAISFLTPHYFVSEKVQAKKKIAWIHTDYATVQVDVKSELRMWGAYDHIASISEDVTNSFLKTFPSLKDKIVLIENILPKTLIEKQAKESVGESFDKSCINLLSIGRFSTAKNFDNIPDICRHIVEKNMNVKWYLIGYGGDENLIRQKIAENGMQDHVIILGKKENPYPYIKMCDIYVQPSRYEGKCVAVREAQMLGKPVIITNYATSGSQLEAGVDGIIVPMENEGCADGIIKVIADEELQNSLKKNVRERDYTNSAEIDKVYQQL